MAQEGSTAYAEGAYELLLDEMKKRGIEESLEGAKSTTIEPEKVSLTNDETKVDTFVELIIISNEQDTVFLKSVLDATDIPYYFQSLSIRGKDLPVSLMVAQPRVEEAIELLKDFKPNGGMVLW
jgi:hypothetical protein